MLVFHIFWGDATDDSVRCCGNWPNPDGLLVNLLQHTGADHTYLVDNQYFHMGQSLSYLREWLWCCFAILEGAYAQSGVYSRAPDVCSRRACWRCKKDFVEAAKDIKSTKKRHHQQSFSCTSRAPNIGFRQLFFETMASPFVHAANTCQEHWDGQKLQVVELILLSDQPHEILQVRVQLVEMTEVIDVFIGDQVLSQGRSLYWQVHERKRENGERRSTNWRVWRLTMEVAIRWISTPRKRAGAISNDRFFKTGNFSIECNASLTMPVTPCPGGVLNPAFSDEDDQSARKHLGPRGLVLPYTCAHVCTRTLL